VAGKEWVMPAIQEQSGIRERKIAGPQSTDLGLNAGTIARTTFLDRETRSRGDPRVTSALPTPRRVVRYNPPKWLAALAVVLYLLRTSVSVLPADVPLPFSIHPLWSQIGALLWIARSTQVRLPPKAGGSRPARFSSNAIGSLLCSDEAAWARFIALRTLISAM